MTINKITNIIGVIILIVGLVLFFWHTPAGYSWQNYIYCVISASILLYVKNNHLVDIIKEFINKKS